MNDFIVKHDETHERFTVDFGGDEAELSYMLQEGGTVVFHHTYVPGSYREAGVAKAMAQAAVEYFKEYDLDPWCGFMKHYIKNYL